MSAHKITLLSSAGWTNKTDLSTDAKKDEVLADAQYNAIRKVGRGYYPQKQLQSSCYL